MSFVQDMVSAGDQEITSIERAIDEINQQIEALTSEREGIRTESERRAAGLQAARETMAQVEPQHSEAVASAKLAQKKPNEKAAIKAVSETKKALDAAQKELRRQEREDAEYSQLANARGQEIAKQIHLLQFKKETHEAEMRSVQKGRDKAHAELGKEMYEQSVYGYQEMLQHVDRLKEELVSAQAVLHDLHADAVLHLAPWPDLQKEMSALSPLEDSTARMTEQRPPH